MFLFLVYGSLSTVYFEDELDDDWEQRWVYSKHRPSKGDGIMGQFQLTAGNYYANAEIQRGLQTVSESGYYQITSKFKKPFNTSGKTFVVQYTVKFEDGYECSGAYIKLLGKNEKPLKFNPTTPYQIMFGPDVCEKKQHKLYLFITRNETSYDVHKYIDVPHDELTHSYTLIIFANKTYEVRIDGEPVLHGENINTDFEIGGPKYIPDPTDLKPEDWDDREEIPDPNDKKPADWDERPTIPDPDARQPSDWRESIKGKWVRPMIKNPDFLGVWKPKMIPNPNYKGDWIPKQILNPEFIDDPNFAVFEDMGFMGLEVFQAKPGTIFDNFLVTDDLSYAEKKLRENFLVLRDDEAAAMKRYRGEKRAEEELHKLRHKSAEEKTDADFYSSSATSSTSSTEDDGETDRNFIFSTSELPPQPSIQDFEFPYNCDNNPYFMKQEVFALNVASKEARDKLRENRDKNRAEKELKEDFNMGVKEETEL